MSNIVIRVNGNSAGDGFLIAPDGGGNFSVPLNLSTNDGTTVQVTTDATPNGAGVSVPAGPVSIGPAATSFSIQATAQSAARGDTVVNVRVGGATTSFKLTAIRNPAVWFRGRFEGRGSRLTEIITTTRVGPTEELPGANPADPAPAESNQAGFEAMALFECHIDGFFSGTSATAADRPTASGLISPLDASEMATAQFIDPATGATGTFLDQTTFELRRLQVLQAAFNVLSPADQTGTPARRNLSTRISHLQRSTTLPAGWDGYEEYQGLVNTGVTFQPVQSSVLDYLKGYATFNFYAKLFTFHNDELCGYVRGSLTAKAGNAPVPPAALSSVAATPDKQTHPRLVRHGKTQ